MFVWLVSVAIAYAEIVHPQPYSLLLITKKYQKAGSDPRRQSFERRITKPQKNGLNIITHIQRRLNNWLAHTHRHRRSCNHDASWYADHHQHHTNHHHQSLPVTGQNPTEWQGTAAKAKSLRPRVEYPKTWSYAKSRRNRGNVRQSAGKFCSWFVYCFVLSHNLWCRC